VSHSSFTVTSRPSSAVRDNCGLVSQPEGEQKQAEGGTPGGIGKSFHGSPPRRKDRAVRLKIKQQPFAAEKRPDLTG